MLGVKCGLIEVGDIIGGGVGVVTRVYVVGRVCREGICGVAIGLLVVNGSLKVGLIDWG